MKKHTAYGNRLREARLQAGLTQKELGAKTGIKQGTISKIERGDQDNSAFDTILAHHLKVNAYWLATGEGDRDSCVKSDSEYMILKAFRIAQNQGDTALDINKEISRIPE